jgi:hypothetical protein
MEICPFWILLLHPSWPPHKRPYLTHPVNLLQFFPANILQTCKIIANTHTEFELQRSVIRNPPTTLAPSVEVHQEITERGKPVLLRARERWLGVEGVGKDVVQEHEHAQAHKSWVLQT